MSTVRQVTFEDADKVKNLIERCMVHYMDQKEIIHTLHQQQNIEPVFTLTILQKLEDQNPEFFKAYYVRVLVNQQIKKFNSLLEKQAALMNQLMPNNQLPFPSISNNSNNIPPVYHVPADLPSSSFNHGGPSGMQNVSNNEVGLFLADQNVNGGNMLNKESIYSQSQPIDNASVAPYNNMDPNPYRLNGLPANVIYPYLLPNPDISLDGHGTIVENQGDNRSPHNPSTNSQNFGPEEQL